MEPMVNTIWALLRPIPSTICNPREPLACPLVDHRHTFAIFASARRWRERHHAARLMAVRLTEGDVAMKLSSTGPDAVTAADLSVAGRSSQLATGSLANGGCLAE